MEHGFSSRVVQCLLIGKREKIHAENLKVSVYKQLYCIWQRLSLTV